MLEKAKNNQGKVVTVGEYFNSLFSGKATTAKDVFIEEDIPYRRREVGLEYIVQVRMSGGTIVQLKTGRFNHKAALREVPFAIQYCTENYGNVLAWNWLGQEEILRTPFSAHTPADRTLKQKIVDFFFGDDEEDND